MGRKHSGRSDPPLPTSGDESSDPNKLILTQAELTARRKAAADAKAAKSKAAATVKPQSKAQMKKLALKNNW